MPTKRRVVHGVVVSADDRYAFVSVEGVAAEPGTVEVIDLDVARRSSLPPTCRRRPAASMCCLR